jgi:hypothetical protein
VQHRLARGVDVRRLHSRRAMGFDLVSMLLRLMHAHTTLKLFCICVPALEDSLSQSNSAKVCGALSKLHVFSAERSPAA